MTRKRRVSLIGNREKRADNPIANHPVSFSWGKMSESFDPYLKWLGIRDPQRPPNHYRLLGLDPLEDDLDVIASAADRQMAHVRRFQHGEHLELSQQLLNELAAARVCLLNREKKLQYDEQPAIQIRSRRRVSILVRVGLLGLLFLAAIAIWRVRFDMAGKSHEDPALESMLPDNDMSVMTFTLTPTVDNEIDTIAGMAKLLDKRTPPWEHVAQATDSTLSIPLKWTELQPSLRALQQRALDDAAGNLNRAHQADSQAENTSELRRIGLYHDQLTHHWRFVDEGLQSLKPGQGLDYWRSPVTVVSVETDQLELEAIGGQKLVFQLARDQIDPYLAAGITLYAMRESGPMAHFVVGTFLALDDLAKDKSLASDYLRLASEQGIPTNLLCFPALEKSDPIISTPTIHADGLQPATPEVAGLANTTVAQIAEAGEQADLPDESPPDKSPNGQTSANQESASNAETADIHTPTDSSEAVAAQPIDYDEDDPDDDREELSEQGTDGEDQTQEMGHEVAKHPIPDSEELEDAKNRVSITYKDQLANRNPAEQLELFRRLKSNADLTDDDVVRYVLLWKAVEVAGDLGRFRLAFTTMDRIDDYFDIDVWEEKQQRIEKYSKTKQAPKDRNVLIRAMWQTAEQAAADHRWKLAEQTIADAIRLANKHRNRYLADTLRVDQQRFEQSNKLFTRLSDGVLDNGPGDDRQLNQRVGEYLCFVKNNYANGLAYLAQGDNQQVAEVAKLDLANRDGENIQQDLGDRWLNTGKQYEKPIFQASASRRARYWYQMCLRKLKGLASDEIQRKIVEIDRQLFTGSLEQTQTAAVFSPPSRILLKDYEYTGDTPITVEAFVRPAKTTNSRTFETVVSNGAGGGWSLAAQLGKWRFQVHDGTSFQFSMSEPLALNQWVHLAGVYDGRQVCLYVDGLRQQRIARVQQHKPSQMNYLTIGASLDAQTGAGSFFTGQIREVRISLSARYTSKNFIPPPGLALDADTVVLLPFMDYRRQIAVDVANLNRRVEVHKATLIRLEN